jgi:hypothetical protein
MRTKKQIDASRANGAKSHGAASPEGKARIVAANLDTGMFAEYETLPWENRNELEEIQEEYYAQHPPASPEARALVDELIRCEWRLRRFHAIDDTILVRGYELGGKDPYADALTFLQHDKSFVRLQYRINSVHRAQRQILHELERIEARDRAAADAAPSSQTQLQVVGSLRSFPSTGVGPEEPESST